jgi:hypothetical protein
MCFKNIKNRLEKYIEIFMQIGLKVYQVFIVNTNYVEKIPFLLIDNKLTLLRLIS